MSPAIAPTHVLFGLTFGINFLLPKRLPIIKANVSHIHTDKNIIKVISNPLKTMFLIGIKLPINIPTQTIPNIDDEIFLNSEKIEIHTFMGKIKLK